MPAPVLDQGHDGDRPLSPSYVARHWVPAHWEASSWKTRSVKEVEGMKFVGPAQVVEVEHQALALGSPFEEQVNMSLGVVGVSPKA